MAKRNLIDKYGRLLSVTRIEGKLIVTYLHINSDTDIASLSDLVKV